MTSEFDRFKTEGNRLLKAGEIEMAVVLYTSAAAAAESSRQAAIALGNRSLAQFRLENLAAANITVWANLGSVNALGCRAA